MGSSIDNDLESPDSDDARLRELRSLRAQVRQFNAERRITGFEIHDGLAQQVAAAKMHLEALLSREELEPNARNSLCLARDLLVKASNEARALIGGVELPLADEGGLAAAIGYLVTEIGDNYGRQIDFQNDLGQRRFSVPIESSIYRLAQESLNNAARHSQSDQIALQISADQESIFLEVRDQGIGFDLEAIPTDRFGLRGMRERTTMLGGRLTIETSPGAGTCIRAEIPLDMPTAD